MWKCVWRICQSFGLCYYTHKHTHTQSQDLWFVLIHIVTTVKYVCYTVIGSFGAVVMAQHCSFFPHLLSFPLKWNLTWNEAEVRKKAPPVCDNTNAMRLVKKRGCLFISHWVTHQSPNYRGALPGFRPLIHGIEKEKSWKLSGECIWNWG